MSLCWFDMEVVSRDTGCYTTDIGKMAGTLRNFYIHHSHNALVLGQDSCIPPLKKIAQHMQLDVLHARS